MDYTLSWSVCNTSKSHGKKSIPLSIANDRGGFASVHIDLLCLELAPGINHLVAKTQSWM